MKDFKVLLFETIPENTILFNLALSFSCPIGGYL